VADAVRTLQGCGVHVSLFIDPVKAQIECAKRTGAHAIEIHTGTFCNADPSKREEERAEIANAAALAARLGLEVHAGHGLDYQNVLPIAQIPEIVELNIGHSIIARAVIVGVEQAVREMKQLLVLARP
jgi:pyridoxine 5-phosphate synthase